MTLLAVVVRDVPVVLVRDVVFRSPVVHVVRPQEDVPFANQLIL